MSFLVEDVPYRLNTPTQPSAKIILAHGAHAAHQLAAYRSDIAAINAENYAGFATTIAIGSARGLPSTQDLGGRWGEGRGAGGAV